MTLRLRNPHSVLAALETRPKDVVQVLLPQGKVDPQRMGAEGDAWARVAKLARDRGISIGTASREPSQDSRGGGGGRGRMGHPTQPQQDSQEGGRTGLAEAIVKERQGISAEELFKNAAEKKGGKGLWIALDHVQDPHNAGAIFRMAGFFGVQGILMTQERSAPLSATVYDVACGGLEYVPYAIHVNLQRAFEIAKDSGLWILGTSEHAKGSITQISADRPWLLVLGNEEKGMRRLTEEACDQTCQIPPQGKVTSLNVSVAAGILISRLSL